MRQRHLHFRYSSSTAASANCTAEIVVRDDRLVAIARFLNVEDERCNQLQQFLKSLVFCNSQAPCFV
jgi:hypothetical protein